MKKIVILLVAVLFTLGSFACKSKKKCPAYSHIYKTETTVKA